MTEGGKSLVIVLPTVGCRHYRESGGCVFCSYAREARGGVTGRELLEVFDRVMETVKRPDPPFAVKIFTSGSFLDPEEVPPDVRRGILARLADDPDVSEVCFESRPEFVRPEILEEVAEVLGGKPFEVGIGLETADDGLRELLRKDVTREEFEEAVENVKEAGGIAKAYVLLKPPFLSEAEAVLDCVESCLYAWDVGCERVSVCPMTVHAGTPVERWWRAGLYRPPWLWSVVEVVVRVKEEAPDLVVNPDTAGAGTPRGPSNCRRCSGRVASALEAFRPSQDVSVFEDLDCRCRGSWREDLTSR
ncbi:MAG: archaeosine biosynthesis radical SAM protein RaSEA [Methanopyri archaeon]|nr:archaeosine biosynthesis radical SAM protein RaSEA [Methanopyri archaeon]